MNKILYSALMLTSLLLLVIASMGFGYIARNDIGSLVSSLRTKNIETPEECINLSMVDSARCLNNYVNSIFKYKERPDIENPSLEELKTEGGDCLNWAELYSELGNDLGFNMEIPIIDLVGKYGHAFAVMSDETGYCLLDQTAIKCYAFGEDTIPKD